MKKICPKCKEEKLATCENFYVRKDSGRLFSQCKLCMNQRSRERWAENKDDNNKKQKDYYCNNKEYFSSYRKEYNRKNKEKIAANHRQYYIENKSRFAERARNYTRERKRKDPAFKLRCYASIDVGKLLKRNGSSKCRKSILDYLPYSIVELKRHLESKFESWMNWDNWGKYNANWDDGDPTTWTWQIDHIIPQSDFSCISMADSSFQECWGLSNIRPLSAKKNLMDGVNRTRHLK